MLDKPANIEQAIKSIKDTPLPALHGGGRVVRWC